MCRRALRHLRRVRAEPTEAHKTAFIGRAQPYGQSVTSSDNGKVAAAKFFAQNVLPRLSAECKIIEAVDLTVMDLREEAF